MRSTRARGKRTTVTSILAGVLLGTGAGCGWDHAENKATDNAFVRAPDERAPVVAMNNGPLLPTSPKNTYLWEVVTRRRTVDESEVKDEILKKETEEVHVAGERDMERTHGTAFEIRKDGKPFREEIFSVAEDGLYQVAAGLNDKVMLSPPLMLVRLPLKEGEGQSWTGVLKYQKIAAPGTAYSRVTSQERIKVPAGEFGVWRIDTVIATTIDGHPISFPMTRWFAPGVGMVKQRLFVGNILVEKQLRQYRTSGK